MSSIDYLIWSIMIMIENESVLSKMEKNEKLNQICIDKNSLLLFVSKLCEFRFLKSNIFKKLDLDIENSLNLLTLEENFIRNTILDFSRYFRKFAENLNSILSFFRTFNQNNISDEYFKIINQKRNFHNINLVNKYFDYVKKNFYPEDIYIIVNNFKGKDFSNILRNCKDTNIIIGNKQTIDINNDSNKIVNLNLNSNFYLEYKVFNVGEISIYPLLLHKINLINPNSLFIRNQTYSLQKNRDNALLIVEFINKFEGKKPSNENMNIIKYNYQHSYNDDASSDGFEIDKIVHKYVKYFNNKSLNLSLIPNKKKSNTNAIYNKELIELFLTSYKYSYHSLNSIIFNDILLSLIKLTNQESYSNYDELSNVIDLFHCFFKNLSKEDIVDTNLSLLLKYFISNYSQYNNMFALKNDFLKFYEFDPEIAILLKKSMLILLINRFICLNKFNINKLEKLIENLNDSEGYNFIIKNSLTNGVEDSFWKNNKRVILEDLIEIYLYIFIKRFNNTESNDFSKYELIIDFLKNSQNEKLKLLTFNYNYIRKTINIDSNKDEFNEVRIDVYDKLSIEFMKLEKKVELLPTYKFKLKNKETDKINEFETSHDNLFDQLSKIINEIYYIYSTNNNEKKIKFDLNDLKANDKEKIKTDDYYKSLVELIDIIKSFFIIESLLKIFLYINKNKSITYNYGTINETFQQKDNSQISFLDKNWYFLQKLNTIVDNSDKIENVIELIKLKTSFLLKFYKNNESIIFTSIQNKIILEILLFDSKMEKRNNKNNEEIINIEMIELFIKKILSNEEISKEHLRIMSIAIK